MQMIGILVSLGDKDVIVEVCCCFVVQKIDFNVVLVLLCKIIIVIVVCNVDIVIWNQLYDEVKVEIMLLIKDQFYVMLLVVKDDVLVKQVLNLVLIFELGVINSVGMICIVFYDYLDMVFDFVVVYCEQVDKLVDFILFSCYYLVLGVILFKLEMIDKIKVYVDVYIVEGLCCVVNMVIVNIQYCMMICNDCLLDVDVWLVKNVD